VSGRNSDAIKAVIPDDEAKNTMVDTNDGINTEEWRGLIKRLSAGEEPEELPNGIAPLFDDPSARKRVGDVITKAVLGEPLYNLYRLYCGDPSPQL
jgi:hypothetical protein